LNDLYTSNNTLKSILNVTGSQCKDLRTGVICSYFGNASFYSTVLTVYLESTG